LIEAGVASTLDVPILSAGKVELGTRTKLARSHFLGAPAHSIRDIAAVDAYLITVDVEASDDDVDVRIVGVVVVDRGLDCALA
jgi:hypothetical protein